MSADTSETDVLIVGGGPTGLATALELRHRGVRRVVVLDRDASPGGVPRYTHHIGYGARDLHRVLTGPAYARRYAELARRAGAEVLAATTAIEWTEATSVLTTSRAGLAQWRARAIVLATGCRERPRAARLIPGDRPAGIFTTGSLQRFADLHGLPVGRRAVVVGAEHVSFSAVHTLIRHGVAVAAVVTDLPAAQTFPALRFATADVRKVPVAARTTIASISGRARVTGVTLRRQDGALVSIACDTVVFTGDWIPDNEFARLAGLPLDAGTAGPVTDQWLRTPVPGIFAAGNLVHAAETADACALAGRHAAGAVVSYLAGRPWPAGPGLAMRADPPLRWVFPARVRPGEGTPPLGRLSVRAAAPLTATRLRVSQGDRVLYTAPRRSYLPNRAIHLPARWLADADPDGADIRVGASPLGAGFRAASE